MVLFEHNPITLLQNLNGKVFGIRNDYLGIVDAQSIDYEAHESMPTGPCYGMTVNQGIYWFNDFGTVIIMPTSASDKKKALIDILQFVQFKEDGLVEKNFRQVGEEFADKDEPESETDSAEETDPEE